MFTKIYSQTIDGFEIVFSVMPEDDAPEDHFALDPETDAEICEKIRNGDYQWFIARVEAYKNGVHLGQSFLGACCYETFTAFIEDAYYADMAREVIAEARANIASLTA